MVFIHGGSFTAGSSNPYGADFLVNNGVILVTVNYRLGPFGFLSLGSAQYSGNMGLKDQQLALEWIHHNIVEFGGDIDAVTLFGHSAGAVSVHMHMLSSASRQLFQQAIVMSGCALNPWATNSVDNDNVKLLKEIGKNYVEIFVY